MKVEKPEILEEWDRKNERSFVNGEGDEIIIHQEIVDGDIGTFIVVLNQENSPLEYKCFVADEEIEESIDAAVRTLLA